MTSDDINAYHRRVNNMSALSKHLDRLLVPRNEKGWGHENAGDWEKAEPPDESYELYRIGDVWRVHRRGDVRPIKRSWPNLYAALEYLAGLHAGLNRG